MTEASSKKYSIQSKLAEKGKQRSDVDVSNLERLFREFHEKHGTDMMDIRGEVWNEFIFLCELLMFDNHFIRFDTEWNIWVAEEQSGQGPWIEIDLDDYFYFSAA